MVHKKGRIVIGIVLVLIVGLAILPRLISRTEDSAKYLPPTTPAQQPTFPTHSPSQPIPKTVLLKLKPNSSRAALNQQLITYNAKIVSEIKQIGTIVLEVPEGQEATVVAGLQASGLVAYAERDHYFQYDWVPNDSNVANQWAINVIKLKEAWDVTKGTGIKIALLDSGIDKTHPDLAAKIVATKVFSGTDDIVDTVGHGTHTAGIAAAATNNSTGVAGTCPECQILMAKNGENFGQAISAAEVTWATDNGAKVISMSFSGEGGQTFTDAINYAWGKGVVLVASAGNNGNTTLEAPGSLPNVLTVASTDENDTKSSFSNYGPTVEIAAPGSNIYSSVPQAQGSYKNMSGTSMSAPMVAGVAGLIWATSHGTSNQAVVDRICNTADKIAGTGTQFKCGRINAFNAVQGTTGSTPVASTSAPTAAVPVPSQTCLGSCPTIPVAPTTDPYAPPALPIGGAYPTTSVSTSGAFPTLCDTTTSGKYKKKKHKKKKQGSINKFMYMILLYIMQLIEQMNKGAGGTMPVFPTNPCDITTPAYPGAVPTVDPAVPTIDPFVPTLGPNLPPLLPTVDPSASLSATVMPPIAAPTANPTP